MPIYFTRGQPLVEGVDFYHYTLFDRQKRPVERRIYTPKGIGAENLLPLPDAREVEHG